eukprot:m.1300408 g.1300408  ORF g.1300408 m.1300408 type:complete len:76 (-) comp24803_c0_seq2:2048-2275(-)
MLLCIGNASCRVCTSGVVVLPLQAPSCRCNKRQQLHDTCPRLFGSGFRTATTHSRAVATANFVQNNKDQKNLAVG